MFRKIALAYNESPEAQRALISAIELAKSLKAELHTVTVITALPAYTAYVAAADASLSRLLLNDRVRFYETLRERAAALAHEHDIELTCHLVEGSDVDAIVNFVREQKTDLLMLDFINVICMWHVCGARFMNWRRKLPAAFLEFTSHEPEWITIDISISPGLRIAPRRA